MATPNMATITASLERSLQNFSLNHQHSSSSSHSSTASGGGVGAEDSAAAAASPTLDLNSQASLPFHWEQCLDLKSGEIYYINWRTGMKATEDPRAAPEYGGDYYSEEEDDDSSSYDSDGSSSESSPSSSREQCSGKNNQENCYYQEQEQEINNNNNNNNNNVLVVAGCKSCLMYYMVPKQHEICPKCCGRLLHFDRSENAN